MLMQTVLHICLADNGRALHLRAHAIKRQVNAVLGNLVRLHYPGEVTRTDGTRSPATCWANYTLSPDMTYGTAQGIV
jgi:hypothetical protein